MARPNPELIEALRKTAIKLKKGQKYMWGHMGACNCGNLAQELTQYSRAEIHEYAMRGRGDWSEQAEAYCDNSEMPIDVIISELLSKGLTQEDLINLERLSGKEVLALIPHERRINLKHNSKDDVVYYMETWAGLLESQLLEKVSLPEFELSEEPNTRLVEA